MTLYEIDSAILDCVDEETGEIIDSQKLEELEVAREKKIEGVALWVKNLTAEAKAISEEKSRLAEREKVAKAKLEGLKNYLQYALNGQKFETARVSISYRKSEGVVFDDYEKFLRIVDDDYLVYKEPEPDKVKIKTALKDGIPIAGCKLETRQNMQIK